eukprot:3548246-Pleurochrysis_carterae.AAC.3
MLRRSHARRLRRGALSWPPPFVHVPCGTRAYASQLAHALTMSVAAALRRGALRRRWAPERVWPPNDLERACRIYHLELRAR